MEPIGKARAQASAPRFAADPRLRRITAALGRVADPVLEPTDHFKLELTGAGGLHPEPAYTLVALAIRSPRAPGHVPEKGTYAKKPGWSPLLMKGRTSSSRRRRISSKSCGSSGGGPPSRAAISSEVARRSGGIDVLADAHEHVLDAVTNCLTSLASRARGSAARVATSAGILSHRRAMMHPQQ